MVRRPEALGGKPSNQALHLTRPARVCFGIRLPACCRITSLAIPTVMQLKIPGF